MTLNASGPISLAGTTAGQSIEIENGGNGTTQISLNDAAVRTLAGVPSGAITMPTNFYGKSNRVSISYTFSSNTSNASLNVSSIGGYSSGKSDITVTVNSGVYLYATSTGNYGLNLSGGTTGDTLTLVNNGNILGQGGVGAGNCIHATSGGPALNVGTGVGLTINNGSGYIGGGGGGGGTGNGSNGAGGGAGAGTGGNGGGIAGGSGGGPGGSGSRGSYQACVGNGGGGGGRIIPGSGGSAGGISCNGAGYGGGSGGGGAGLGGNGGSGGSAGSVPPGCLPGRNSGGGGGGWGASGGSANGGAGGCCKAAGSGGKAINKNGNTVTFSSGCGRVYGAVS